MLRKQRLRATFISDFHARKLVHKQPLEAHTSGDTREEEPPRWGKRGRHHPQRPDRRHPRRQGAKPRPQPGAGHGPPARRRHAADEAARGHAPWVACADAPRTGALSAKPRRQPGAGQGRPARRRTAAGDANRGHAPRVACADAPSGRGRSAPNPGDSLERAKDGPPVGATPPTKRTADTRRGSRALTPPAEGFCANPQPIADRGPRMARPPAHSRRRSEPRTCAAVRVR